jgi:hypothetical protein
MRIDLDAVSDFFNPMVVKELRQELRMRAFVNFFIWPQVAMATILLLRPLLGRGNWQQSSGLVDTLFWGIIIIPLFIFLPRRASLSFAKEAEANTTELVHLTSVNALSMTIGKWCALALQTTLFIVAALPYVSMRYFVSGVDILGSLTIVGLLWLSSMLTAAFLMIGSAVGARNKRQVPVFVLIFLMIMFGWPLLGLLSTGFGRSMRLGLAEWIGILTLYPFVVFQLLVTAATRAAPPHEDYAKLSRLCTLVVLCLGTLISFWLSNPAFALGALGLVLPALIGGLVSPPHALLLRRARRYGELRAVLLSSGWPGEVLFMLFLTPLAVLFFTLGGVLSLYDAAGFTLFVLAGLLVPRIYMLILVPSKRRSVFPYFLYQAITIFLALIVLSFNNGSPTPIVTAISPWVTFFSAATSSRFELSHHLPSLLVVLTLSMAAFSYEWQRFKREMQAHVYVPQPLEQE